MNPWDLLEQKCNINYYFNANNAYKLKLFLDNNEYIEEESS